MKTFFEKSKYLNLPELESKLSSLMVLVLAIHFVEMTFARSYAPRPILTGWRRAPIKSSHAERGSEKMIFSRVIDERESD